MPPRNLLYRITDDWLVIYCDLLFPGWDSKGKQNNKCIASTNGNLNLMDAVTGRHRPELLNMSMWRNTGDMRILWPSYHEGQHRGRSRENIGDVQLKFPDREPESAQEAEKVTDTKKTKKRSVDP
jgi:hypothetical protein